MCSFKRVKGGSLTYSTAARFKAQILLVRLGLIRCCQGNGTYVHINLYNILSKVAAPQDAHGRLMLQIYLGSNTVDIRR